MRIYLENKNDRVGIDTEKKVFTSNFFEYPFAYREIREAEQLAAKNFLENESHRYIKTDSEGIFALLREIDFNMWDFVPDFNELYKNPDEEIPLF